MHPLSNHPPFLPLLVIFFRLQSYFYAYAEYELQRLTFLRGLCSIETASPCAPSCNNSIHDRVESQIPGGFEDGADCVWANRSHLHPECDVCSETPTCIGE